MTQYTYTGTGRRSITPGPFQPVSPEAKRLIHPDPGLDAWTRGLIIASFLGALLFTLLAWMVAT